ncbi:25S rRNA (adenine645-N1)-methyltransferase [Arachnomyces sp. PD_36]|nr:25S rRNA (adenine645-N1)-methyltransferase [Arachnomyces sp. PD_36]
MFAVQGWSVPASSLKQQTQPQNQNNSQSQSQTQSQPTAGATTSGGADTGGSFKSRKRKRDRARAEDGDEKITKSNLDGMWKRHIEGQTVTSKPKNQKSGAADSRRQQKTENGEAEQRPAVGKKAKKASRKGKKEKKDTSGSNSLPLGTRKPASQDNNDGDGEAVEQVSGDEPTNAVKQSLPEPPAASTTNLTPLQQSMRQKLLSSRFRHLNETLYTTPSSHALDLFTSNPELFAEYHAGFSRQVAESWPSNPVDGYIKSIKARGAIRPGYKRQKHTSQAQDPLPRAQRGVCTVADLGCGDAQLARALSPAMKSLNLKFLSFDLHVSNPAVTKADISALPLGDGTVDVTIFCLSLMGTNWVSFVEEAWRILRSDGKGECWVSEVKSRFGKVVKKKQDKIGKEKPKPKKKKQKKEDDGDGSDVPDEEIFAEDARAGGKDDDETDISTFIEVFNSRGFVLKRDSVDKSNKMFIKMAFIKTGAPSKGKWASSAPPPRSKFGNKTKFIDTTRKEGLTAEEETKALKPCVYKTR